MNLMTGSKKENIGLIATKCGRLVKYLEAKNNILLLTTSTRYRGASLGYPKDYATRASNQKAFEAKRKACNRARCCESQNTYLRGKY